MKSIKEFLGDLKKVQTSTSINSVASATDSSQIELDSTLTSQSADATSRPFSLVAVFPTEGVGGISNRRPGPDPSLGQGILPIRMQLGSRDRHKVAFAHS